MRSITLSQTVSKAQSWPPFFKPVKPHSTSSFLSLNSLSKNINFRIFLPNPCLLFSGYSRQCCEKQTKEAFKHVQPPVSQNLGSLELRGLDGRNCQATRESILCISDKSHAKYNLIREHQMVASNASYCGLQKFVLLFWCLTLQGSHQAFAATDFTDKLQSIPFPGDLGDISTGFASAFLLIFFSELGDKTFFIAALLAAGNSAATVFTGTFGALVYVFCSRRGNDMISAVLRRTFHYIDEILPFRPMICWFGGTDLPIDDIAAVCLLEYFGVSTLIDASSSDGLKVEDEQKELAVSELSGNGAGILAAANTIISTFLLVSVAEWGDKSFFSTVALAAASSPFGVIVGALAGHGVATLIAVLGGSFLGTVLSEQVIAYIGGILVLVFAVVTLVEIVN